jgi:zinc D-Ala-D-Ala carboxypeptidase
MEGFNKFFTFEQLTVTSHQSELYRNREESKPYLLAGKRLSKLLGSIREILGDKPIKVTSGFRGETLNRKVGGAKASKHLKFEAADIVPIHTDVQTAFNTIMKRRNELPDLRRVIIEKIGGKEWLHVEVKMDAKEDQVFASIGDDGKYRVIG